MRSVFVSKYASLLLALAVLASPFAHATQMTDVNLSSTGSVTYNSSTNSYTLNTSGSNTSWLQNFYYASLTGNFDVIAQVTDFTSNNSSLYTGILAANNLSTNGDGTVASLLPTVSGLPGPAAYYYVNPGAPSGSLSPGSGSYSWLQLSRNGNTFYEQASLDGTNWTLLGSQSVALNTTVDVGVYINDTGAASSTFTNISGLPVSASTGTTGSQSAAVPGPSVFVLMLLGLISIVLAQRSQEGVYLKRRFIA